MNVIPFHKPQPPMWVPLAGMIVGSFLFVAIIAAWGLAGVAQVIADHWEH